jgi:hypothetical protein
MENKKLQIGDKVYCIQYGGIQNILIIDRTTEKTAFSSSTKFVNNIEKNNKVKIIGGSTFSIRYWDLENAELKEKYKKTLMVRRLNNFNFEKEETNMLQKVCELLKINV